MRNFKNTLKNILFAASGPVGVIYSEVMLAKCVVETYKETRNITEKVEGKEVKGGA